MSISGTEFAEHLRGLDESALLDLLSARPDLMTPTPSDFNALAARASTTTSVRLAARELDHFTLTVLRLLHETTDVSVATRLEGLVGEPAPELALRRAYSTLDRLGLIWASGDGWRAAGELDIAAALPRPVSVHPPELATTSVDSVAVDRAGAGSVAELIRLTEQLLHLCSRRPPEQLRAGGVSTREMRRLATELNIEPQLATVLLELCLAAGLLALDEDGSAAVWLPSVVFDHWRSDAPGQRWAVLARSWLTMRRQPSLVEQRDNKARRIAPLSAELTQVGASWLREQLLACFEQLPKGSVTTPEAVQQRLAWTAPLRIAGEETAPDGSRVGTVRNVIGEAATLGLLGVAGTSGRYGLTSFGRELLHGGDPEPALSPLLPEPVDHVLVQADLTVIAPGPLTERLSQAMALIAYVESAGSATVYRVTAQSLRHAFDSGWTRDDLQRFFVDNSATPVPQALSYLIDDTARRHGGLRAGTAAAYVRSDDESLITAVLSDPRCHELRLRALAPTVAITPCATQTLVESLRAGGYAAAAEDASGALVVRASQHRRVTRSLRVESDPHVAPRTDEQLQRDAWHAIERLRTAEERRRVLQRIAKLDADVGPEPGVGPGSEAMVGLIGECIQEKRQLWIRFVDAHGGIQRRLVRPLALGGGYLRAEDERNETSHTLALHRIASATLPD